jgi:hypothetical protein
VTRALTGIRLPLAVAGALYAGWIVRSAYEVGGRTYFSLFDDAMISMQYGRNLADGHGLVWNAGGDAVEGYTNLLWTLWMGLVHLLPLRDSLMSLPIVLSGLALLLAAIVLARAIGRELAPDQPLVGAIAAWATALCFPLVFWSLGGMEVGLLAVITAASVLLALRLGDAPDRRRVLALGALLAGGVLVRDDFLVTAVAVAAFAVLRAPPGRRGRVALVLAAPVLAAIAGHELFRALYYDDLVPNTYHLKVEGTPLGTRLARGASGVAFTAVVELYAPLLLAATYLVGRGRRVPAGAWLLVGVVTLQFAYSLWVGGDAWEGTRFPNRYVTPGLPLLMVLAGLGVRAVLDLAPATRRRFAIALAAAFGAVAILVGTDALAARSLQIAPRLDRLALGIAIAWAVAALALAATRWRREILGLGLGALLIAAVTGPPLRDWRLADTGVTSAALTRVALALRQSTAPSARLAVTIAGTEPYFSHRPSIDLLGKTDRAVAADRSHDIPFWPGHTKWDYAYSIGRLRPDVVVSLWNATPDDRAALARWGYRSLGGDAYVRADSSLVDAAALSRRLAGAG